MRRSFEEKEILTVKQLAEYLKMDEHTIYRFVQRLFQDEDYKNY